MIYVTTHHFIESVAHDLNAISTWIRHGVQIVYAGRVLKTLLKVMQEKIFADKHAYVISLPACGFPPIANPIYAQVG